jgi:hypothetical protein
VTGSVVQAKLELLARDALAGERPTVDGARTVKAEREPGPPAQRRRVRIGSAHDRQTEPIALDKGELATAVGVLPESSDDHRRNDVPGRRCEGEIVDRTGDHAVAGA